MIGGSASPSHLFLVGDGTIQRYDQNFTTLVVLCTHVHGISHPTNEGILLFANWRYHLSNSTLIHRIGAGLLCRLTLIYPLAICPNAWRGGGIVTQFQILFGDHDAARTEMEHVDRVRAWKTFP